MEAMITTTNLSRSFPVAGSEPFYALRDVSITVPKGQLTILRGKSGSGKTTLINLLGALDEPSAGEIVLGGREYRNMNKTQLEQLRRHHMGFVFQSVSLIPMMSVYENVEFALRLSNYEGNFKTRVAECLDLVGLSNRVSHMPQELSGGEQQRVAIARAIAHCPEVIFADEPTAELDSNTSRSVIKTFRELVESQGITIVMTTHDMSLMSEGDQIITLSDGQVLPE